VKHIHVSNNRLSNSCKCHTITEFVVVQHSGNVVSAPATNHLFVTRRHCLDMA